MNLMFLVATISMSIPLLILMIIFLTSARSNNDREKLSPFECGFDPNHSARIPFSTRFFLLAIIFIVFDIEIVLLMPIPLIYMLNTKTIMFTSISFLLILLIGLIHEWNQGSLDWAK